MQTKTLGKKTKKICHHCNQSRYLARTIVYGLLSVILFPVFLLLIADFELSKEWAYSLIFLLFIFFIYKMICSIQAWVYPEKGMLGKSLKPYLDGTKNRTIAHLFHLIDEDLSINGIRFGHLRVGKEWVLGNEAMRIQDIRGIFHFEFASSRSTIYYICLVDHMDNVQQTYIVFENDWKAAYNYLIGFVPLAYKGDFDDYTKFIAHSNEEREKNNRVFEEEMLHRKTEKETDGFTEIIFRNAGGMPASNYKLWEVYEAINKLDPDQFIRLTPSIPISVESGKNIDVVIHYTDETTCRFCVWYDDELKGENGLCASFTKAETKELAANYIEKNILPDTTGWVMEEDEVDGNPEGEEYVLYVDNTYYEHITFDDIAAAFDDLKEGKCSSLIVRTPSWINGYMSVEGKIDDYTVEVAGFNSQREECGYRTHTIYGGHVISWLLNYYESYKYPNINEEWENISQEVIERNKKSAER